MIGGRVFVVAPIRSGRNQHSPLVTIRLGHLAGGILPFRDQLAARAVLKPSCDATGDLLHSTTVPVVDILARRYACHSGSDESVFAVVSIARSGLGYEVSRGVIKETVASNAIVRPAEIGES